MSLLDTPVRQAPWAAIDFEGTGTAPGQSDEAVQIGIAAMEGSLGAPGNFFRSYVRASARVTAAATAVHRITDRELDGAPSLAGLWPEVKQRLTGAVVVAHGAGTEKRFLRAFPLHGFGPWLDTLTLARAAFPSLADHSLSSVAGELGLHSEVRAACPQLDWHDALFDAVASLLVARGIIDHFGLHDFLVGQLLALDGAACARYRRMRSVARDARLGS